MRASVTSSCISSPFVIRPKIGTSRETGSPSKATGLILGFSPQFHHIFPRGSSLTSKPASRVQGITADQVEALANIAIIGAGVNIRISDKDPLAYFAKYGISLDKRTQQFIEGPLEDSISRDNYPSWLNARAQMLADVANALFAELRGMAEAADAA